jgi:N-methylhydantoinase A
MMAAIEDRPRPQFGGTFTDAVATDETGRVIGAKTPPTPLDFALGVFNILEELAGLLGFTRRQLACASTTCSSAQRSAVIRASFVM